MSVYIGRDLYKVKKKMGKQVNSVRDNIGI